MYQARVIVQPSIDFNTLLGVAFSATNEKLFEDTNKPFNDVQKFLACLSHLNSPSDKRQYLPYLFPHVSITVLAAYTVDDHPVVTTICADMAIAARVIGGGVLAVITGKLDEWQTTLAEGAQRDHGLFWDIVHEFDANGLPHPCHTPRAQLR